MCLSVDLCRPRFVVLITPTPALVISHNSRQPRCKEHPKKAAVAPEIRLTRERKDVIAAVGQSVKKCDSAVGFASPRGHPCSMLGPTKHSRPRQKKVSRMVGIGQRFKGTKSHKGCGQRRSLTYIALGLTESLQLLEKKIISFILVAPPLSHSTSGIKSPSLRRLYGSTGMSCRVSTSVRRPRHAMNAP